MYVCIKYMQINFVFCVIVTLSQHIPTLVTLVSLSHNLFQLVLLNDCQPKQPNQLWT